MAVLILFSESFCTADEASNGAADSKGTHAGFFYDRFKLTLGDGDRVEAVGPFFYDQHEEEQHTWAFPPLFSHTYDAGTDSEEYDFLYPALTYDRFGQQYRWALGQLLNFSGGPSQVENKRDRFTLFPIYFQQRSTDTNENYTAVFPLYGHLKNRLFRDEISFVLFPIYGETRKKDVITDNYLYPFFHLRHGNELTGWQLWPIAGREHKDVTYLTNMWGDVRLVGGHEHEFIIWPFYINNKDDIGTADPKWQQASLPFYNFLRSPERDQTTVLWPFFTWVDDRGKKYQERELPWPFVVLARGEGKHTTRVFPFYSQARRTDFVANPNPDAARTNRTVEAKLVSDFYMWPIYKYTAAVAAPLDRHRTRIALFLYSDTVEKNTGTDKWRRRVDLFPFYHYSREMDGSTRLQVLSILEPYLPNNKSVIRNYSQVYSFWRSEHNAKTGASSRSLLWNLYRHEERDAASHTSAFFGLYQSESNKDGKRRKLFFIPTSRR